MMLLPAMPRIDLCDYCTGAGVICYSLLFLYVSCYCLSLRVPELLLKFTDMRIGGSLRLLLCLWILIRMIPLTQSCSAQSCLGFCGIRWVKGVSSSLASHLLAELMKSPWPMALPILSAS